MPSAGMEAETGRPGRSVAAIQAPAPPAWALALFAALLIAATFRPVIEGDGVGYYAYLHAVVVAHSLDFTNEYSAAIAANVPLHLPLVSTRTSTGHLANYFPVGPALLSLPAYLIALAFHPAGEPQYGSPFIEAFTLSSLLYGLLALAISYRIAESVIGNRRAAILGAGAATLATPVIYYAFSDPSYSHTFSIFCVSAFLYAWWKGPPTTYRGWFGFGLLGGLMALARFQDGLLVAVVLVDIRRVRWPAWAFPIGAVLAFGPQLLVDEILFGGLLPERPPGQALDPVHGHYLQALFSSIDGLFVWTPVVVLAAIGFLWVPDRRLRIAAAIAFVLELLVIGSAPDTAGAAFGPRRFLDLIPFGVIGLAALAARIGPRYDWAALGVFCVWNLILVANFEYLMVPGADPGYSGLLGGQMRALPFLPRLLTKGAVVRDLLLWRAAHQSFKPAAGLLLLVIELGCVAVTWRVARAFRGAPRSPSLSSTTT